MMDLSDLARERGKRGITSVCSAHPLVLRAALRLARDSGRPALIEATCNQVNQQGGYTGMRPADFARLVHDLAQQEGCPQELIILGGDHLGPNPWRHLPADEAMALAEACVADFVAAGFRKIHLDASMGCKGEAAGLDDATTAGRAARLARAAEQAAEGHGPMPHYIIGTEVPPPGGADHVLSRVPATDPDAARETHAIHADVFTRAGLEAAFSRVIAMVVQPGVEFGNHNVVAYDRPAAARLVRVLDDLPGLAFEAHSTDYQPAEALQSLVRDGFAILKVGPGLTFALREALYALDLVASDLVPGHGARPLMAAMEGVMLAHPENWQRHYGAGDDAHLLRHYSLSDRIRYYWPARAAQQAVADLRKALQGRPLPLPLLWQHLPEGATLFANRPADVDEIIIWRVTRVLRLYQDACRGA